MSIGILGGTFDPVHLGHLAIAGEARLSFNLAKVIFVPAGQPYFKDLNSITPAQHRLEMLKLAVDPEPCYEVSMLEVERPGPSFAVDTVSQLKNMQDPREELFFILGWDSLMNFPTWKDPRRLLSLCFLVAAPRPGYPPPDVSLLEKDLPGISARTFVMEKPLLDISSTDIRRRVREGKSIRRLVPAVVADYIAEHRLYPSC